MNQYFSGKRMKAMLLRCVKSQEIQKQSGDLIISYWSNEWGRYGIVAVNSY